jgi:molybdopterin-containing oxidoreductase family iron-sulfur binding subunit
MKNNIKTENSGRNIERRKFMKFMVSGIAAIGGLSLISGCTFDKVEKFFQKHFQKLTPEELKEILSRMEKDYKEKYNVDFKVTSTPPIKDVMFGYGLDLTLCTGCRECVYACVAENNESVNPQIQWIRVLEMKKEDGVDLLKADAYFDPAEVPDADHFYMPVQCQQCKNPPCTKVCPVSATWKEPDGIVVVDYNWCIGCRCCMAACPYSARHFNWKEPLIPKSAMNTNVEYLGNRPRYKGVVEKCTFCIQRVRQGKYPACVEACPVGARKFGNLLDADSEIRLMMRNKKVYILKKELNTQPSFFYFYTA